METGAYTQHYYDSRGVDAQRPGEVLRVRTVARLAVNVGVGIGPSILAVVPGEVADWLGRLPVDALHSIGPREAETLRGYGIHCVGLLAAV